MATPKYRKGVKVTCGRLQIHSTVLDVHTSHRVRRGDAEIVVGDEEKVDGVEGKPLETYVSYLVESQWDGARHWVSEDDLEPGHDMTARGD